MTDGSGDMEDQEGDGNRDHVGMDGAGDLAANEQNGESDGEGCAVRCLCCCAGWPTAGQRYLHGGVQTLF